MKTLFLMALALVLGCPTARAIPEDPRVTEDVFNFGYQDGVEDLADYLRHAVEDCGSSGGAPSDEVRAARAEKKFNATKKVPTERKTKGIASAYYAGFNSAYYNQFLREFKKCLQDQNGAPKVEADAGARKRTESADDPVAGPLGNKPSKVFTW